MSFGAKNLNKFWNAPTLLTRRSANPNGAASQKSDGLMHTVGQPSVCLSSPRQPYKKFRGDPPRLAGIRPDNRFLDKSLPRVHQQRLHYAHRIEVLRILGKGERKKEEEGEINVLRRNRLENR